MLHLPFCDPARCSDIFRSVLVAKTPRPGTGPVGIAYGLDWKSAFPVAMSIGTETCSWTISHLPSAFS